jgi:DNA-binding Xre family transcriptional regulator
VRRGHGHCCTWPPSRPTGLARHFLSNHSTARGLSQRKLAEIVGIHFQVIRRIEAGGDDGNLTLRDLDKICRSLRVQPAALLTAPNPDPAGPPTKPEAEPDELTLGQARLLRRIQRDPDVRRGLSTEERQLVLPALLRRRLIRAPHAGRPRLSPQAETDLKEPDA